MGMGTEGRGSPHLSWDRVGMDKWVRWLRVPKGGMLGGKGPLGWFLEQGKIILRETEGRGTGDPSLG